MTPVREFVNKFCSSPSFGFGNLLCQEGDTSESQQNLRPEMYVSDGKESCSISKVKLEAQKLHLQKKCDTRKGPWRPEPVGWLPEAYFWQEKLQQFKTLGTSVWKENKNKVLSGQSSAIPASWESWCQEAQGQVIILGLGPNLSRFDSRFDPLLVQGKIIVCLSSSLSLSLSLSLSMAKKADSEKISVSQSQNLIGSTPLWVQIFLLETCSLAELSFISQHNNGPCYTLACILWYILGQYFWDLITSFCLFGSN